MNQGLLYSIQGHMLFRAGIIAVLALLTSITVFLGMQMLIEVGGSVLDEQETVSLVNFIHVDKDDDINTKNRELKKPPAPPKPPPTPKSKQEQQLDHKQNALDAMNMGGVGFDVTLDSGLGGVNTSDGEYLPIIKVAPIYPRSAAQRGIEGFVVLEFTVNEQGAVIDPVVINAEPPGIFNRAAIDAARKFKYKPKVVDGKPVSVSGVKNLIRFELEKNE